MWFRKGLRKEELKTRDRKWWLKGQDWDTQGWNQSIKGYEPRFKGWIS